MEADAAAQTLATSGTVWINALKNFWQWSSRAVKVRKPRRLRVCETLSLGDRRFLAVVEFDHQEFLVGGTGNSLELMARLHEGRVVAEPALSLGQIPLPGGRIAS